MYAQHRHWSPEPEQVTGIQAKSFRHDPYSSPIGKLFYYPDDSHATPAPQQYSAGIDYSSMPMQTAELPHGTRHTELWGRVSFVPYPTTEFYTPAEALPQDPNSLVRVFLGQLPYFVTDMQLSWLCYTFGGFNVVAYPERIMKRQPNGERLPTGCIHAYASEHAIEEMAAGMHKRMLVDDTGVWHAQSDEELQVLTTYIASMKSDKTKRVPGRPYDTVVVQMATSTFVPLCPMPLSEFPSEYRVKPQRVSPPPYEAAVNQLPPPYHV